MKQGSSYGLIDDMLEVPGMIRRFDPAATAEWRRSFAPGQKILVTGEGSSRIFPAKNMIHQARLQKCRWHIFTEGARQATEYDLSDTAIVGLSNSGRTKELIALLERLGNKMPGFGITATPGSVLTETAGKSLVLSCGAEKAVAASKSVIEQALTLQSLLSGDEWGGQAVAADAADAVLKEELPQDMIDMIARAETVYIAGRNDGVAEELALKTNEITRQKSAFLEGTYALHGIEEVMTARDVVILVEPFAAEMDKYHEVLAVKAGIPVIAISARQTPFETIRIPSVQGFDAYLQIMAGWNLLTAAGIRRGVDIDRPLRARKVGNSI